MTGVVNISQNWTSSEDESSQSTAEVENQSHILMGSDENDQISLSDHSDASSQASSSSSNNDNQPVSKKKRKRTDQEQAEGSGLADVFAKILKKEVKDKAPVVLAKAKTDKELLIRRLKEEGTDIDAERKEAIEKVNKKREWENIGKKKPSVFDREKERQLARIATRGVVQLFNAVRKQQKEIDDRMKAVGNSELKKDDVIKGMNKGTFLDMLKEKPKSQKNNKTNRHTDDVTDEPEEGWDVLGKDYAMRSTGMKDWSRDKEGDDVSSDDDNADDEQTDSDDMEEDDR